MAIGRAVGIDLGTTYSAVAVVDEYGKPIVLKNADGQSTTPSAVFFDQPNYVVGETALQSTITDPDKVVQFVKRFMGQTGYRVHVANDEYSPQFISALILKKIVQDASVELGGEEITKAVITVPAYFTENQRHATMEAGQMAGLQVLRIINEPTAAALSYGMQRRGRKRNCLVYDLGGGTFDVTVLAIDDNELNVLSIGGDHHLGGKDFDDRIMNFVEEQVKAEARQSDISEDKENRSPNCGLKCEAAKRQHRTARRSDCAQGARFDEDGNDTGNLGSGQIESDA
jgi:molecular chaperone DnaK